MPLTDHEISEMKDMVTRIDERTLTILQRIDRVAHDLNEHETEDRQDFKDLHSRVNAVERKQNWIVGIGTAIAFAATIAIGFMKAALEKIGALF